MPNIEFVGFREYFSNRLNIIILILVVLIIVYWMKVIFFGG